MIREFLRFVISVGVGILTCFVVSLCLIAVVDFMGPHRSNKYDNDATRDRFSIERTTPKNGQSDARANQKIQ